MLVNQQFQRIQPYVSLSWVESLLPSNKSIKDVSIKDARRQGSVSVRVGNKRNNIDVRRKGTVILSRG